MRENTSSINIPSFSSDHPLSYEHMFGNRSEIPQIEAHGKTYDAIFNGGWLRIRTKKGVDYMLYQASCQHLVPDWKIHFSIARSDLAFAWNIIGNLFIEMGCNTTMKMLVPDYDNTRGPEFWGDMKGREITVYIYRHKSIYSRMSSDELTLADQLSSQFWQNFIVTAEARLTRADIQSQELAVGDKPLGLYASLRNEAFIAIKPQWRELNILLKNIVTINTQDYCYPPNIAGYNAAGNINPLASHRKNLFRFFKSPRVILEKRSREKQSERALQEAEYIFHS